MNTPIAIKIECAKGEIMNALQKIQREYGLPLCIIDGVFSDVLAEIKSEAKLELISATNMMMREKEEEIKKAKEVAKKVLKEESKLETEYDTGQHDENQAE